MKDILIVLTVATVISYAAIPFFRKLAFKTGFVDKPNHRKTQKEPLPMLGGLGMALVFACMVLVSTYIYPMENSMVFGILIGTGILIAVGLMDDYAKSKSKDFPAFPKLLAQIAASYALIESGIVIQGINIPHYGFVSLPPLLGEAITLLWVVGIINAINWIDGMDGLAGGIAAISGTSLMFVAVVMGQTSAALLAAILVGTTIGYLRYNFYPAKLIMGDTGAMYLGYVLGAISVLGALKTVTVVSVLVPVLALGLPIFDGIYVVIRRLLAGKPFYSADRTHMHHRLLDIGLNQKQAVTFLYLIGTCLGMASLIVTLLQHY